MKISRRSESVALTNRHDLPKIKSNLSEAKQAVNNSVGRKPRGSSVKPKLRPNKSKDISDTNSRYQSSSKKNTKFKSYMRPTEVSTKKNSRNKTANTITYRQSKRDLSLSEYRQSVASYSVLAFFDNLRLKRDEILHMSRHNKAFKYIYFLFAPQIIT